jgi:hypothetical protein
MMIAASIAIQKMAGRAVFMNWKYERGTYHDPMQAPGGMGCAILNAMADEPSWSELLRMRSGVESA